MSIRKSKIDIENTDEAVDYTDKTNPQDTATGMIYQWKNLAFHVY